jgi:hypothetical protein
MVSVPGGRTNHCTSGVYQSQASGWPNNYILYCGTQHFNHSYCSFCLITYQDVYQFTCTEQIVPGDAEVHRLRNCRSTLWNLLHITLLVHGIWRWLLDFL